MKIEKNGCIFLLLILAVQIKQSSSTRTGQKSSSKPSKNLSRVSPGQTSLPSFAPSSSYTLTHPDRTLKSSPAVSKRAVSRPSSYPNSNFSCTYGYCYPVPAHGFFLGYVGYENVAFQSKCNSCCKRFREQESSSNNRCYSCWLSKNALAKPIPPHAKCQSGDPLGYTSSPTRCFFQRCRMALRRIPWRPNCKCEKNSYNYEWGVRVFD